ncbi:MAG TPA: hypothetical protein VLD67_17475, partial [Vicinamibacterales bacterium]|nr:hypothetical protein [Vicinamibacterales bacterium]
IHTIHTGGVGVPPSPFAGSLSIRRWSPGQVWVPGVDRWAIQSLANISEFTGGVASRFVYGSVAARRIDEATRFNYLLGYAPSDTNADGRYRRVMVRVNRRDVTVLYRHGYYANAQLVPYDREQFMTYNRIVTAGNHTQEIRDIQLALEASTVKAGDGSLEVAVDLSIDTARVAFADDSGTHVAALEVAIFCGDRRQNVIGELWQTIDLKLSAEALARAAREGIRHTAVVPVKAAPRYVKAIVYDRNADVVGTATSTLR